MREPLHEFADQQDNASRSCVAAKPQPMNRLTVFLVAAAAGLAAPACSQPRVVTETELLSYASTPYRAGEQDAPREVLGKLNGVDVIVDFICSDLCPAYTVRIIRFDVEPGPHCTEAGGVERTVVVPVAITSRSVAYCFPKVLAENWSAYVK